MLLRQSAVDGLAVYDNAGGSRSLTKQMWGPALLFRAQHPAVANDDNHHARRRYLRQHKTHSYPSSPSARAPAMHNRVKAEQTVSASAIPTPASSTGDPVSPLKKQLLQARKDEKVAVEIFEVRLLESEFTRLKEDPDLQPWFENLRYDWIAPDNKGSKGTLTVHMPGKVHEVLTSELVLFLNTTISVHNPTAKSVWSGSFTAKFDRTITTSEICPDKALEWPGLHWPAFIIEVCHSRQFRK
jgi:hypothetical protein